MIPPVSHDTPRKSDPEPGGQGNASDGLQVDAGALPSLGHRRSGSLIKRALLPILLVIIVMSSGGIQQIRTGSIELDLKFFLVRKIHLGGSPCLPFCPPLSILAYKRTYNLNGLWLSSVC